ncbi:MAG: Xaa-Pro dipeptidase [Acidobacteriota bacterium]|nr:Xaa-Pro dipeptidase [Acidobacteriota bacterium]MDQ7087072.1 Xaa-Pro dipeptidase [Acidobacteriota bacterium]
MTSAKLYRAHLEALGGMLEDALTRASQKGLALDGVLFHAGRETYYHADDQPVPFRGTPHFLRWVPLAGPEHCVLARPGHRPLVIRVAPRDFWYEVTPLADSYWQAAVEVVEVCRLADARQYLQGSGKLAYVGNSAEAAEELGIPTTLVEPEALMAPLAWHRATKTDHEVAQILRAAEKAAEGHRVARKAFESGASEKEIHWAYLEAAGQLEAELPFATITAIDEKIAILHYQNKRGLESAPGKVFMLDAGASHEGYASDITRTWARPEADDLYRSLLAAMDALQRDLVAMVTPGRPYAEIHLEAHRRTALLLAETGIVRCSAEQALEQGITRAFLPHGVGHHLGLQVHDLGGHQAGPDGGTAPPPAEHPFLRNTRTLEPGHVVTIEPGIYFCDVLLDELRERPEGKRVEWKLVERLSGHGGVRIEDDVLCTPEGARDLTRPLIQGPRGL